MVSKTYITLASNDSLDHYPENRLNHFTNVLPRHFIHRMMSPNTEKIFVRLRSIAISPHLHQDEGASADGSDINEGKLAHVHLSELEPQIKNGGYARSIGQFFLSTKNKAKSYDTFNFEHAPYLPLRSLPIAHLTVTITDIFGQKLALKDGFPTFVSLEVVDMDLSREFTISCNSHLQNLGEVFANNNLTHFKVPVPEELNLDGWEVALLSASCPPNLKRSAEVWISFQDFDDENTKEVFTWNLFDFVGKTKDDFAEGVKTKIAKSTKYGQAGAGMRFYRKDDKENENHGFFHIVNDTAKKVTVKASPRFCDVVGEETTYIFVSHLDPGWQFIFKGESGVGRGLPSSLALVNCNIVESSAVGSSLVPLLHMMPLRHFEKDDKEKNSIYEPQHLIFHKVRDINFSYIEFQLTQPNGENHEFETDGDIDHGMNFTLLFRPITDGGNNNKKCSRLQYGQC